MTRQEFLEELRIALQGEISQSGINQHLQYYDNYIMEEARKGKTEQQVIEELGSPRLIAKTLIDTAGNQGRKFQESGYGQEEQSDFWGRNSGSGQWSQGGQEQGTRGFRAVRWLRWVLLLVLAGLIIGFVARLVAFLLPIVIPILLILLIVSWIFGRRR